MSPRQGFLLVAILTSALLASCVSRSNPWKSFAPERHDREHVASEIRQNARRPLIGLPFADTLTVQCLKNGTVRMVLDLSGPVPHTNNPQHVWQPPPVRDMTFRINRGKTQAVTFNREFFDHGLGGGLSYRYVADERSEPRLLAALDAMSRGRSMRRFDMVREPKYVLSPAIGKFVAACHRSARAQSSVKGAGQ